MTDGKDAPPTVGTVAEYREHPVERMREWAPITDLAKLDAPERDHYLLFHPNYLSVLFDDHAHLERYTVGASDIATKSVGSVNGDQWRAQRTVQQPYFAQDNITGHAGIFKEIGLEICEELPDGGVVDIHQIMKRNAVRMIARTVFGFDVVEDALLERSEIFTAWHDAKARQEAVPADLQERFENACRYLEQTVEDHISQTDPHGDNHGLAPLLLAAGPGSDAQYTHERVRDELIAKLFSAHRTTAQAWTYTLYLLAEHPEATRTVTEELGQVSEGGNPAPKDLESLSKTEQAVREALRMYPPVPVLSRQTTAPLTVENHEIPAESVLYFPQAIIHHDERWWDQPGTFLPNRFDRGEPDHPSAYFPFGAGPRRCLGDTFAMAQAKMVVATVLSTCTLDPQSEPRALSPGPSGVLGEPIEIYVLKQ